MTLQALRRIGLATLTAAVCFATAVSHAEPAELPLSPAEIREVADNAFDAGRYAEALAGYELLAWSGDMGAARRAGELLLYGQGLLARGTALQSQRAVAWLTLAAASGDEGARAMWLKAMGANTEDSDTPWKIWQARALR